MRKMIFSFFLILFGLRGKKHIGKKRGTIIILIDGLSYDALNYAIKKRYCPTLKRLSKGKYQLHKYYCGLPAATTATEALLFYGTNDNIPGFTWFDRSIQKFVRGNRSLELSEFEDLFLKKRNLLENGSVIMGVYAGGATELSMSGRNLTFSRSLYLLKTAHYFLMALLYPIQLIRTVYLTLKTLILYRRANRQSAEETFAKMILGQFSCFLTEIEIMRNTEKIFVDFLLYDEYAHQYGPTHSSSLSILRLVDRYIKRIVRSAQKAEIPYEIIILSDHGQTESIPIDYPIIKSVQSIKNALNNPSYEVVKTYGGILPSTEKKELYIVPSGSILQLYFSHSLKVGLFESQINVQFPEFLSKLLQYDEYGWILVKQSSDTAVLYGKNGSVQFFDHNLFKINKTPFPDMSEDDVKKTIESFQRYALFSNNGDIVLFGNTKQKKVYSFEKHKGTHGGFYGPMVYPFVMSSNPKIAGDSMGALFDTIALEV